MRRKLWDWHRWKWWIETSGIQYLPVRFVNIHPPLCTLVAYPHIPQLHAFAHVVCTFPQLATSSIVYFRLVSWNSSHALVVRRYSHHSPKWRNSYTVLGKLLFISFRLFWLHVCAHETHHTSIYNGMYIVHVYPVIYSTHFIIMYRNNMEMWERLSKEKTEWTLSSKTLIYKHHDNDLRHHDLH